MTTNHTIPLLTKSLRAALLNLHGKPVGGWPETVQAMRAIGDAHLGPANPLARQRLFADLGIDGSGSHWRVPTLPEASDFHRLDPAAPRNLYVIWAPATPGATPTPCASGRSIAEAEQVASERFGSRRDLIYQDVEIRNRRTGCRMTFAGPIR